MADTRAGYDRLAAGYAERFLGELAGKPLDRMLLDHVAATVAADPAGAGPVADVGCGPGHAARHLAGRGATALGVDLSPRMIEIAAATHPGIGFRVGDMRRLPAADGAWAGIVALYSIIHLAPRELPGAFAEFTRVLRPGGIVLVSFHVGDETRHVEEMLGQEVSLDFQFYRRDGVESALAAAGLAADAYLERRPYESEVDTTRAYVLAHRPRRPPEGPR